MLRSLLCCSRNCMAIFAVIKQSVKDNATIKYKIIRDNNHGMIRIDSQALNLLLSTPPPALAVCSADPSLSCKEQLYDDCIRKEKRADGDDASVGTAETVWSDDTEESDDEDNDDDLTRRVCFVEPLVTEEWTREYTPQSDVAALYYSSEDTTRCVFYLLLVFIAHVGI